MEDVPGPQPQALRLFVLQVFVVTESCRRARVLDWWCGLMYYQQGSMQQTLITITALACRGLPELQRIHNKRIYGMTLHRPVKRPRRRYVGHIGGLDKLMNYCYDHRATVQRHHNMIGAFISTAS